MNKLPITLQNFNSLHYVLFFFLSLYIVLVLMNYDHLKIELNGTIVFWLVMASVILFTLYFLFRDNPKGIYFLVTSIIVIVFSIFLLFSTYEKYEIRDNFITDPVNVGIIVLVLFCLINLFIEKT